MIKENLFHISDDPKIKVFEPRPAPFYQDVITQNVVFAISNKLLHNYLLPRNCPRVTFYAGPQTSEEDKNTFLGTTTAKHVVCVEAGWLLAILRTTLYCYELPPDSFSLLDECAGYYISYSAVIPVSGKPIYSVLEELLKRDVELRFMPSLLELAELVKKSTLNFSLIRMHHAQENGHCNGKINFPCGYAGLPDRGCLFDGVD
jgi:hypothetical protein